MSVRIAVLLPVVLLLALFAPVPSPVAADTVPDTVVDTVDGLPGRDGVRAQSLSEVTGRIRTPITFSMLAFTAPAGAEISYRTSVDGETWTLWHEAHLAEGVGPDAGTAEARDAAPDHRRSGEPMWVGEAAWLQARVAGAAFDDVDVDLIDSMGLSRSLLDRTGDALRSAWHGTTPSAQAAGRPAVVTRAQWGADESLRKGSPSYADQARYAILHHTVNTNDYTRDQAAGIVRGIYAYHTRSRGWSDIGYNLLVDRFGTIYEGRAGGLDRAVIGAHALGFNTGAIGVAMIGDHDAASVPSATRGAVARIVAWKFAVHGIDPSGTVAITSACTGTCRYPKGRAVRMPTLFGHRDVGYTSCPGATGHAILPGLRSRVAGIQIDTFANASVAPGTVQLTDEGFTRPVRVATDVVPAGDWSVVIKDNDGTVVHEASGSGGRARIVWSGRPGLPTGTYWYKFTGGGRSPAIGRFSVERAATTPPFSDDDGSVHAEGIATLYARGITKGCTTTTFCPAATVRRGQMASFVARTMDDQGIARPEPSRDWFTDDTRSVHRGAIDSLTSAGITTGCARGRFCPDDDAIRIDVAVWLAAAFDLSPGGTDHFTDDDGLPGEWAINALADAGLTQGCTATTYCPQQSTSRGQMASFLARAITTLESTDS